MPALFGAFIGTGQSGVDNLPAWEAWGDGYGQDMMVDDIWCPDPQTGASVAQGNISAWKGHATNLVVNVPLVASDGGMTLAHAATGSMDEMWDAVGDALVANGFPNAILVIGKMWNEERFPWFCNLRSELAYKIAWRRCQKRIAPKSNGFTFDWITSTRNQSQAIIDLVYPGDDVVDRIGLAVYGQTYVLPDPQPWDGSQGNEIWRWLLLANTYGLRWCRAYAERHGKRMSVPEWSVGDRQDGYGMATDNPRITSNLLAWFDANDVEYACYWDADFGDYNGAVSGGKRPKQSAVMQEWLGAEVDPPPDPPDPEPEPATNLHRGGYTGAGGNGVDAYHNGWSVHVSPIFEIAMAAPPFYSQGGGALNDIVGNAGWNISSWANAGLKQITWSVPLATTDGPDLNACNNGEMDQVWRDQASILLDYGYNKAIVRPGWEWNGEWWFPWYAGGGRESLFASVFRRCVDCMRSVGRGQAFQFEWAPNVGQNQSMDWQAAYPGDDHVDLIGLDYYPGCGYIGESYNEHDPDQPARLWAKHSSNEVFFLGWQLEFARQHGKNLAYSEWGLGTNGTGGLCPDNPDMMRYFLDWIDERNSGDGPRVVLQAYYSEDNGAWQTCIHEGTRPQQTKILSDWLGG